jgi:hypothetical protein
MTPAQVDDLDDLTYNTFVRFMVAEARAVEKASKGKR